MWSYFWKISWGQANKLIRTVYIVAGSLPVTVGAYYSLPIWPWIALSTISVLFILLFQVIKVSKNLDEKAKPKLSVSLIQGNAVYSRGPRDVDRVYKIILKNEGIDNISDGTLIYSKLHDSFSGPKNPMKSPRNKFVKQTEDGNVLGGWGIVPKKTRFSLHQEGEIEFDALTLREHLGDQKISPKLSYYGVSEITGLDEYEYTLDENGEYTIGFRASHNTGSPLNFTLRLRVKKIDEPVEVSLEHDNTQKS